MLRCHGLPQTQQDDAKWKKPAPKSRFSENWMEMVGKWCQKAMEYVK